MEENGKKVRVLFLDSGIGGIPYFNRFRRERPEVPLAYLADRRNFPYGGRLPEELASLLIELVEKVSRVFAPEIVVLACNTASIAALGPLRERFPETAFVGTVPAVKPAALASRTGKIGVLGTELTVREEYVHRLAREHGNRTVVGIGAPELVDFVENRLEASSAEERRLIARGYLQRFRRESVDAMVLGCTHFLFLLEEFRAEAAPDVAVFESLGGISARIGQLLDAKGECRDGNDGIPRRPLFLLSGTAAPEPAWEAWARRLGCGLLLPEEG